jgi:hypothetical protein
MDAGNSALQGGEAFFGQAAFRFTGLVKFRDLAPICCHAAVLE